MAANHIITLNDVIGNKKTKKYIEKLEIENCETNNQLAANQESLSLQLKIKEAEQFLNLQRDWADQIRRQIWAILLFQFVFVFCVGFNLWGFTDNIVRVPNMFIVVVFQNLANIFTLGYIVTKFLFPEKKSLKNSNEKQSDSS